VFRAPSVQSQYGQASLTVLCDVAKDALASAAAQRENTSGGRGSRARDRRISHTLDLTDRSKDKGRAVCARGRWGWCETDAASADGFSPKSPV